MRKVHEDILMMSNEMEVEMVTDSNDRLKDSLPDNHRFCHEQRAKRWRSKPTTTTMMPSNCSSHTSCPSVSLFLHFIATFVLLVSCVNLANTLQPLWWNKYNGSDDSSIIQGWTPSDKYTPSLSPKRFWATSWTPMISVTPEQAAATTESQTGNQWSTVSSSKSASSSVTTTPVPPFVIPEERNVFHAAGAGQTSTTTSSSSFSSPSRQSSASRQSSSLNSLSQASGSEFSSPLKRLDKTDASLEWKSHSPVSSLTQEESRRDRFTSFPFSSPSVSFIKSESSSEVRSSVDGQQNNNDNNGQTFLPTSEKKIRSKESSLTSTEASSIHSSVMKRKSDAREEISASKSNTVYFDLNNHDNIRSNEEPGEDDFNEASGRVRDTSQQPQKLVSWDDKIEFPSSTPSPPSSSSSSRTDFRDAVSTSSSSNEDTLRRLTKEKSGRVKAWKTFSSPSSSSSTSSLRISNRFGAIRQTDTKTTLSLVQDFKSRQNLEKLFNDAISDIESKTNKNDETQSERIRGKTSSRQTSGTKSSFGRIRSPVSSLRLMNKKKTASSLLQRNGLKTSALIRDDVSADIEKEGENDSEDNDDEEVVSLNSPERDTTTSTTKPLKLEGKDNWEDKWLKAKVTQYFSWETPSDEEVTVSSQETTTPSTTPRSQLSRVSDTRIKGSNKKRVAAQRQTTTTTEEPTTTFNPPRSAAVKTTQNISSQRIRVSSIGSSPTTRRPVTTTPAVSSELESNEEDVPSTTRTPKVEALRKTYNDWSQEAVQDKLLLKNKGSSTSFQSGTGYGWTANIDHSNQRPAQVRTTSTTKGNFVSSSEEQPDQPKILEVDHEADNDANDRVNDDSEVIDDVTTEPPAFTRIKSNQKSNESQRKGIKRRGSLKGKTFQRQQIQQLRETTTERITTEREETTTTTTTTTTTKRPTSVARLQVKGRLQSKIGSRQRQAVTTPTTTGLPQIVQQRQVAAQVKVSSAIKTSQGIQYIDNDQVIDQQDNNSFQENEKISEQEVKGGKFSKKSGVEYTSSSIEREEDISVDEKGNNYGSKFNQRSGQQIDTENENSRLEDAIPGLPLRDYPTYDLVPETSFRCSDHSLPGYYGDVEAQCQVFHVCQADGRKNDFLCPVGTVFNQEHFVCDWWQNFRCQDTPSFYSNNELLYNTFGTNNNLLQNTQLRKRTDSIEREEVEREAEGEEVISGEVDDGLPPSPQDSPQDQYQQDDDQQENKEGARQSNELDAGVKGSLKGSNKRSGRQRQSDVSSGVKSARVSASYGARLAVRSNDRRRNDNWAAASEAKVTSDNDVVTTTTNSPTSTTESPTTTNTVAPLVLRNTTTSPKQTVDRFHLLHMMTSLPIPV